MSLVYLREIPMVGFFGKESGNIIALRSRGDEGLFASRENSPLQWIDITEFTPDPKSIPKAEDVLPDEPEDPEGD